MGSTVLPVFSSRLTVCLYSSSFLIKGSVDFPICSILLPHHCRISLHHYYPIHGCLNALAVCWSLQQRTKHWTRSVDYARSERPTAPSRCLSAIINLCHCAVDTAQDTYPGIDSAATAPKLTAPIKSLCSHRTFPKKEYDTRYLPRWVYSSSPSLPPLLFVLVPPGGDGIDSTTKIGNRYFLSFAGPQTQCRDLG